MIRIKIEKGGYVPKIKTKEEEIKEVLRKFNISHLDKDEIVRRLHEVSELVKTLEEHLSFKEKVLKEVKRVFNWRKKREQFWSHKNWRGKKPYEICQAIDAEAFDRVEEILKKHKVL